jgi:hypothetical protein
MSRETTPMLQAKCDRALQELIAMVDGKCPVTLIAFYNNGFSEGAAFASSLSSLDQLVSTLESRVTRWCGAPPPPHAVCDWIPPAAEMEKLAAYCRDSLPFSASFALICGAGPDHAYASFTKHEDMLTFFHEQVLPNLKAQQATATAERGAEA